MNSTSSDFKASRGRGERLVGAVVFLGLSFATAAVGGVVTAASLPQWYAALHKPSFNPPNWVFGPVWTLLYILMALAAWRIWSAYGFRRARGALALYGLQLALNLGWSVIFFGLRAPGPALLEIGLMFAAITATTIAFSRLDRIAGAMFVPYLAWVGFAALLNFAVWRLN